MVTGDNFHVPDGVLVTEDYPIVFSGTLGLNNVTKTLNPTTSGVNVRQNNIQHRLLFQAVLNKRISLLGLLIGGSGLGGTHCNVATVDPVFTKLVLAIYLLPVRRTCIALLVSWQVNREVVVFRLILSWAIAVGSMENVMLGPGRIGIFVPRDHRGTIRTSLLTNKNRGTSTGCADSPHYHAKRRQSY